MGTPLVEVADLSVVWVWGEFYQDELPMLQIGQEVTVTSSSYPGEKFRGQITLIDPFIDNVKRTGRVRLDIQNPGLKTQARHVCRSCARTWTWGDRSSYR